MRVDMPAVSGRCPRLEAENSSSGCGRFDTLRYWLRIWAADMAFYGKYDTVRGCFGVWSLELPREFPHLQRTLPAYSISPHKPLFWQSILSAKAESLQSDGHCLNEWAEFAHKLQESSVVEKVIGFLLPDVTRPGMGGIG